MFRQSQAWTSCKVSISSKKSQQMIKTPEKSKNGIGLAKTAFSKIAS